LRRLFAAYNLLNRQIRMVKNAIQATLVDDGVVLTTSERNRLFRGRESASDVLAERHLAAPILTTVEIQVAQLCQTSELKERLATQITAASAPLATQIELLVTIPGIPALTAAAFLADVGDVTRFRSQRQMSAYLGLVPRCHESDGTSRPGHISRKSRKLTRTMLTQSIYQTIKGPPSWQRQYDELKERRGSGRAKIGMIRRLCGVMRRMLLEGEQFHWLKEELYQRKLRKYRAALENGQRTERCLTEDIVPNQTRQNSTAAGTVPETSGRITRNQHSACIGALSGGNDHARRSRRNWIGEEEEHGGESEGRGRSGHPQSRRPRAGHGSINAAHQMGHHLGASHDLDGSSPSYIMNAVISNTDPGQMSYSPASIAAMQAEIDWLAPLPTETAYPLAGAPIDKGVMLAWEDGLPGEQMEVQRSGLSVPLSCLDCDVTTPAGSRSYHIDTSVASGETYHCRLFTRTAAGEIAAVTREVSITVP
ncbi:MAG: transposase, partial [Spirochaetota bacterium]